MNDIADKCVDSCCV